MMLPFRKPYLTIQPAIKFLAHQRCLVCDRYGCKVRFITPELAGGRPIGDNLLPLCEDHVHLPFHQIFDRYPAMKMWLEDHERIDIIIVLQTQIKVEASLKFLTHQRCLVCEDPSCQLRFITDEWVGGKSTGDNLLPLCRKHVTLPLETLYKKYPSMKAWLIAHERTDIVFALENELRKRAQ